MSENGKYAVRAALFCFQQKRMEQVLILADIFFLQLLQFSYNEVFFHWKADECMGQTVLLWPWYFYYFVVSLNTRKMLSYSGRLGLSAHCVIVLAKEMLSMEQLNSLTKHCFGKREST